MTNQDIVVYLNTLIDTDPTLTVETRVVLKEAVAKLEGEISLEEKTQIIIFLITIFFEMGKNFGSA